MRTTFGLFLFLLSGTFLYGQIEIKKETHFKSKTECFVMAETRRSVTKENIAQLFSEEVKRAEEEKDKSLSEIRTRGNLLDRARASFGVRSRFRERMMYITNERSAEEERTEKVFLQDVALCRED